MRQADDFVRESRQQSASYSHSHVSLRLMSLNLSIYIDFYLATVIISMEIFSIQCQERKENTKRKHKINRVVGGFVVFIATLQQKKYR